MIHTELVRGVNHVIQGLQCTLLHLGEGILFPHLYDLLELSDRLDGYNHLEKLVDRIVESYQHVVNPVLGMRRLWREV